MPSGKGPQHGNGRVSAPAGPVVETSLDARRVVYQHLSLGTPEEYRPLARDLSVEVRQGERVAVTGPSAAVRTALLATAGLWPAGQGRISRPGPGAVMFVPDRPSPVSGRLRDLLVEGLDPVPDDRLHAVLEEIGLADAVARQGGLEAERDWAAVLSPGEVQALTFARLLLAGPRFAFLLAPARSLDPALEERLYHALARSSTTYVSMGCPSALLPYHDLRLELMEDGSWHAEPAQAG
jgi:putative ATP-binding cassette transporter